MQTTAFHRGDLIYTLPDPNYLAENHDRTVSDTRTELTTDDMWIAHIVDCCTLKTISPEGQNNLGILRVRWLYSQSHVLALNEQHTVLHAQYVNKVAKMTFRKHEVGGNCYSLVSSALKADHPGDASNPFPESRESTRSKIFSPYYSLLQPAT